LLDGPLKMYEEQGFWALWDDEVSTDYSVIENNKGTIVSKSELALLGQRRAMNEDARTWQDTSVEATEADSAFWFALAAVTKWNSYRNKKY
jgi:hypothetical protein